MLLALNTQKSLRDPKSPQDCKTAPKSTGTWISDLSNDQTYLCVLSCSQPLCDNMYQAPQMRALHRGSPKLQLIRRSPRTPAKALTLEVSNVCLGTVLPCRILPLTSTKGDNFGSIITNQRKYSFKHSSIPQKPSGTAKL